MRILLTGAGGFTGRHFMDAALAAGHRVIPLGANLVDKPGLRDEVSRIDVDAVVHLAGISFVGHENKLAFYDVNLFGTLNLLDALAAHSSEIRCVLLASSANVYGNSEASPIEELQTPAPINHYAMSKLAMEHLARNRAGRLPIIIARPFNYTGPGQNASFLIPKLVDHFVREAPFVQLGNLEVEREFNDVRMVCDAYLRLLDSGKPGETYNVCSGSPHSIRHVLDTLSALTGHQMETCINPDFVRAHELHRLCGDPGKLTSAIGGLRTPKLEETLSWMLREARSPSGGSN